ncbi:YdeI/OmpD-associated family protein [Sphingomonas glaciei]|uniref:YdeI/OmpD-associated family protein n=1 Tax=Sphingomonas glaciei TaxID=2938948 RepID=A0ABY5MWV4_9SPHN|nr:YdeI/OmpD-associated family protein [Sphingomonas glaciei]UUR07817.1 YdeI/OmpD-associated family protein [Sphingomonas glaciei]
MADQTTLSGGTVHDLPDDLAAALLGAPAARATWEDVTPLARNEWICWVTSPKKVETRTKRIAWGLESLGEGKRRPCCWPGCPHRVKGGS